MCFAPLFLGVGLEVQKSGEGFDVFASAEGEDVEFVVYYQTCFARSQGEEESLVETGYGVLVGFCAVAGMYVLQTKQKRHS